MRVAQQLSGLVVLPMAIGYVFLSLGTIRPSVLLFVALALVIGIADAVLWRVMTGMFDRERLLTRFDGGG
jgi:hypothetical protein